MPLNMSGAFIRCRTFNLQGLIIGEGDNSNGANEAFLRSKGVTITKYEDGTLSLSGGNISSEEVLSFLNRRSSTRVTEQQNNDENGSSNNPPESTPEIINYATVEEETALKLAVDLADTIQDKSAILHGFNNNQGGIKRLSSEAQSSYVDIISNGDDLALYQGLAAHVVKEQVGQSYIKKLKF